MEKQFYKKKSSCCNLSGHKGTNDNVDPKILINDFIKLNLPRNLILIIYNLITIQSTRYIQFINCPGNINHPVCKSLLQGSILSPILFPIYINKIDNVITPEIKVLKFADDIVMFTTKSLSRNKP